MRPVSTVSSFVVATAIAVLLCAGSSCRGRTPIAEGEGEGEGEGGFDDHTVAAITDPDAFDALARSTSSSAAAKLVVTRFGDDDRARVRFYDSAFYDLHDEWYWFRLLNGQGIDGLDDDDDRPLTTSHGPFEAIDDVYAWAAAEIAAGRALPLDLRFLTTDERLYSPRFYDLALFNSPRSLGVATLLRFAATETRGEVWALEPEFSDPGDEATVRAFFAAVTPALPDDVAADLKWITRSLPQAETAAAFPADLRARVISFDDVITPGQTEVYSAGTTAGRLLMIRRGEEHLLQTARASDVVVVEDVPDALPQCAALITATPQTALAHVNLLARNRGIPNAFRGGVVDDANLDQLARVRAPVAVRARLDDGGGGTLEIEGISEADFASWRTLTTPTTIRLPPVDLTGVPAVVDLAPLTFAEASALRPVVGGKAAGLVGLTSADVSTVDAPVAVTIAPYVEHLTTTGLAERLPQILQDRSFSGDAVIRRLVLAGDSAVAPEVAASFRESRPTGTLLRDIVDAGGVTGIIRDTPVAPVTLAAIRAHLETRFGRYADHQGLRFRSSSTIEDAEGFNGAGLYESHTGHLRPGPGDDAVDVALRQTWASYWGIEAFEERRLANADHLSGNMAVVVHANFPDSQEVDNGVALFTILPPTSQTARTSAGFVLEVNQQVGSHSVTNPPPGSSHLPEIDRVVVDVIDGSEQAPRIERVRPSTLVLPGAVVLGDATLLRMFADARAVTAGWIAGDNEALVQSRRRSTLTLDFETRTVAPGWPALRSGVRLPSRLVWKQARPLEPGIAAPDDVRSQPIPVDLLARARRVSRDRCEAGDVVVSATRVQTDPGMSPDMGHATAPFVSFVFVEATAAIAELGMASGSRRSAIHTAYDDVDSSADAFTVSVDPARRDLIGLDGLGMDLLAGRLTVSRGGTITRNAECTTTTLFSSPAAFLDVLLDTP